MKMYCMELSKNLALKLPGLGLFVGVFSFLVQSCSSLQICLSHPVLTLVAHMCLGIYPLLTLRFYFLKIQVLKMFPNGPLDLIGISFEVPLFFLIYHFVFCLSFLFSFG